MASRLRREGDRVSWAGVGGLQPHPSQLWLVELTAHICQTTADGRVLRSLDGLLVQVAQLPKELLGRCQEPELVVGLGLTLLLRVEQGQLVIAPDRSPRQGWKEAFARAGSSAPEPLLLALPPNEFDAEEWTW